MRVVALKFRYLMRLGAFRVSGVGWTRIVPEELLREALGDPKTMVSRILCEGVAE